eukprot:TRINITY_DN891_c0_g1_i3.p1 TRINITY_DN891_c0_g1~~TRINITY_DN891_c0_g1_i3.p1  ORF type:complete len:814 (-),score=153.26 TRINITY_DN891_c0_g1_i3:261-2702(-)
MPTAMRSLLVTSSCFSSPFHLHSNSSLQSKDSQPKPVFYSKSPSITPANRSIPPRIASRDIKREENSEFRIGLLKGFLERGKLREFVSTITEVTKGGSSVSNLVKSLDIDALRSCFAAEIDNGHLNLVLDALIQLHHSGFNSRDILDENVQSLLCMEFSKLLQNGLVEECVQALQVLSDCLFCIDGFVDPSNVIQQCVDRKDVNLALRYVNLLSLPHVWCNFLIRQYGKQGDVNLAFTVFRQQQRRNNVANMYLYRDMIDVCGLSGNVAKAKSIFEEMLHQGIIPNKYVYNSIMNAMAGDLNGVLQLFQHMQMSEVMPDIMTYNILLKACRIAKNVTLALHFYEELKEKSNVGHLQMDVITYTTLIQILGDAKKWTSALKIKAEMAIAGVPPDMVTWTALLSACANAGLVEKAQEIFDEMVVSGYQPNSQCCNALLSAFVKDCQYARAFNSFYTWKEKGFFQDSLKRLQKDTSPSYENMSIEMCKFSPTAVTYNILIKACKSAPYHAEALMEEMEAMGLSPDKITWSTLIDAYSNVGDLQGCFKVFNKMCKGGVRPDVVTYTTVIKVTFGTLLRGWRAHGDHFQVYSLLTLYGEMRKSGFPPNDDFLRGLIEEWAEGALRNSGYKSQDLIRKGYLAQNMKENKPERKANISFFEKIAALACSKHNKFTVDFHGLSETEARIVLLAVLRIMRERHGIENPVEDDLIIIVDTKDSSQKKGILANCITKVLKEALGFPGPQISDHDPLIKKEAYSKVVLSNARNLHEITSSCNSNDPHKIHAGISIQERPTIERMVIPKTFLNQWIQKSCKNKKQA